MYCSVFALAELSSMNPVVLNGVIMWGKNGMQNTIASNHKAIIGQRSLFINLPNLYESAFFAFLSSELQIP